MKAVQHRKVARSSALVALFNTRTETSSIIGLPEALALFVTQLGLVETLAERQAQPLELVLSDRDLAFAAMKRATLAVAGKVHSLASRTHRETLALSMHMKGSDLDRVRYIERVRSCQRVHDAVAAVLATIVESGVTAVTLTDLQTKIDAARGFATAPRSTVVDKATATALLTEEIRKLDEILKKQIEPLVAPLEETNREFWLKYRAAGKEVSSGGGQGEDGAEGAVPLPVAPAVEPTVTAATATETPTQPTKATGAAGTP